MGSKQRAGLGREVPPAWEHVLIFFDQAGFPETEAKQFFQHYEGMQWNGLKGGIIRNWKTKAQEWIWEIKLQNRHLRIK
jgi:hypothetical protein